MSKPKLLLIGYRAYGDWLYAVPIFPHLFEKYDVYADINRKGYELFYDDPRFKRISICNFEDYPQDRVHKLVKERWDKLAEVYKPDKIINLNGTLETECIAERYQDIFHMDTRARQKHFGHKNFYEAVFRRANIPITEDINLQGMYFTDNQIRWGERWRDSHKNDFVIMLTVAGSCSHKVWPDMIRYSYEVLDRYPSAYIYLMGDKSVAYVQWKHERIIPCCGELSIKQSILMTRYADMVLGGETGLLVAAGMWGTPKIMLCTSSSVMQANKYHKNDYSIQADIDCSPCHKTVYTIEDCEKMIKEDDIHYPACITTFDINKILDITEKIYNERNIYNRDYYNRYQKLSTSEIGRRLYDYRWKLIEKYCHGHKTLLDYGCSGGAFIKAKKNGFITYGFDVNPYSPHKHMPDRKIDILTMWDVIEHLKKPGKIIRKISPEWLFIATPNKDNVSGDITKWKHFKPDEHPNLFGVDSLISYLNRIGYETVEVDYGEGMIRNMDNYKDIVTVVARRRSDAQGCSS